MKPTAIIGSILVVAGIVQIFVQMILHRRRARQADSTQSAQKMAAGKFQIQSAYPGSTMIGIGAVLLLASEFGSLQ